MKERRYDIDWLRVIAILAVFIFHCTRFFGTEDWHVKVPADEQSDTVFLLRAFLLSVWMMPLFFLLAGFASRYSLKRRTGGQYLLERVKRLLIPLYTVGILILVPPQAYLDGVTHGRITGTFWQWLPNYYLTIPRNIVSLTPNELLDPIFLVPYTFSGHLWFIQLLFVISLVTLPVFLYLKSDRGQRLIDRLAGWSDRPGGIFLFVIPLAIVQIGLNWLPVTTDRTWADFFWYAGFFVAGYVIAADDRFTDSIKRHGWVSLALWIVVFWGAGGLLALVLGFDPSPGHGFSLLYVLWQTTWSITNWSAVVFMLSLGAKYMNSTNRLLGYSNEAVLPFFLFHQTIILVVGWFVLPWDMGNLAKFLLITVISFPLILLLYEVFVRRFNVVRFFFGMRPKRKPSATPVPRPEGDSP
jgi:peptidoglycan/LPS O-acetylase OafA/YrhL